MGTGWVSGPSLVVRAVIRQLITVVLTAVVATTACAFRLSSFDRDVNELIEERCNLTDPCEIRIGDATDFDWDEMYLFRPGLTPADVEAILPTATGFKGEFNRKIAFFKQGKLVKLDEAPSVIEGEHTPSGMLFFDDDISGNPDCLVYSHAAQLRVRQEKDGYGGKVVYKLSCLNCEPSPIFAGFGAATELQVK